MGRQPNPAGLAQVAEAQETADLAGSHTIGWLNAGLPNRWRLIPRAPLLTVPSRNHSPQNGADD